MITIVSDALIVSVAPLSSVAVAVADRVAVPTPTLVMMAPFGVAGSVATVNTVGSDDVYITFDNTAELGLLFASTG